MLQYLYLILAICSVASFVLSFNLYLSGKRNQQNMEKLIIAMVSSILISGKATGEPEIAMRLFNEQFPLMQNKLKMSK